MFICKDSYEGNSVKICNKDIWFLVPQTILTKSAISLLLLMRKKQRMGESFVFDVFRILE